jgi:hypothetical protein
MENVNTLRNRKSARVASTPPVAYWRRPSRLFAEKGYREPH